MIEAHFGGSPPLSVGIEEELMILDAGSLEPVGAVEVLLRDAPADELPGTLKTEMHASVVELNTGVCADVDEAVAALRELRAAAGRSARANGLVVAAAGAHPSAHLESLPVVQEERYLEMIRSVGYAARRQGVNGLHVHVGVATAEQCYERLEAVLPWLPRAAAPPVFGSYAEWEAFVERFVRIGLADGYTRFWWDIRPHPRFGTLEIRAPDQPTSVELTGAFAALLQALCATVVEGPPPRPAQRGDYAQNRWAAARGGLDAQLVHPDGDRVVGARELARELLGAEPPEPEAVRQLEIAAAAGQRAVAADLVARTLT